MFIWITRSNSVSRALVASSNMRIRGLLMSARYNDPLALAVGQSDAAFASNHIAAGY
jgi:hypothetical protein